MNTQSMILCLLVLFAEPFALPISQMRARAVVDEIVFCKFERAVFLCDSFSKIDTSDILMRYVRCATLALRDLDGESFTHATRFFNDANRVVARCSEKIKSGDTSSMVLTIRGLTHATMSAYHLRMKRYVEGANSGLSGLADLNRARKIDPHNTDADFLLGIYECGKSNFKKRLWWVMFWYPGSVENGIRRLVRCVHAQSFTSPGALLALVDVYEANRQTTMAQKTLAQLDLAYPGSRFVSWAWCRFYETRLLYSQAADRYGLLAQEYCTIPDAELSAAQTYFLQAQALEKAHRINACDSLCGKIIQHFYDHSDADIKKIALQAERLQKQNGQQHGKN